MSINHYVSMAARHWVLASGVLLGCSGSPSAQASDNVPSATEHEITSQNGLDMIDHFAQSPRVGLLAAGVSDVRALPLNTDVRYAASAVQDVLSQEGATTAAAALGQNADGTTTLVLRVMDATGAWLPKALANGGAVDASEIDAFIERVHAEASSARALVTGSDGTPIRCWKYAVASLRRVLLQPKLDAIRLALGQTPSGNPTIVVVSYRASSATPIAVDNGFPSPPY